MEIVCPSWCPEADNIEIGLPILAKQGVTAIDIALDCPPSFFDFRSIDSVSRLVQALDATPIRVHSIHAPFGSELDLSSFDDRVHEHGVEAQIDAMELAKVLGAAVVVIHASDFGITDSDRKRRLDRARGVIRELAGVAQESGLTLAIENLPPGYLGSRPEEILWLIEQSRSESVAVCFDTGHAHLTGNLERYARMLLPQSAIMHLHDNDGKNDQHAFPGNGSIDWTAFGKLYNESGGLAFPMLECAPPNGMLWREAIRCVATRLKS